MLTALLNSFLAGLLSTGLIAGGAERGLPAPPSFGFATQAQGRDALGQRDDFVSRLSPFDRAARLKRAEPVSEAVYLAHVRASVRSWNPQQSAQVQAALARISSRLLALKLHWPSRILLIQTSGAEEGGAAYTRGNAIVLPQPVLAKMSAAELDRLLLHELFHVLSRSDAGLKTRLYAAIGFVPCGEVAFPTALAAHKITNPDAPINDFCIRLHRAGQAVWALPILYAGSDYSQSTGGEFFDYLSFKLLVLAPAVNAEPSRQGYDPAHPQLADPSAFSDFFTQVGRNTDYILHPEEILADNFALLLAGQSSVASPDLLTRIEAVLKAGGPIR